MLPALRKTNSSPGSVCVSRHGSIRESEQVTNNARGCCPPASRSNNACLELKTLS